MFTTQLPPDSRYWTLVNGDPDNRRWGDLEYLVANVVDLNSTLVQMMHAAHFKGKPPKIKPVRRPGASTPEENSGLSEKGIAYLDAFGPKREDRDAMDLAEIRRVWAKAEEKQKTAEPPTKDVSP